MWTLMRSVVILATLWFGVTNACNFYPVGEYLRFVRIPENLKVGGEVLRVEVHPRKNLSLQPVEREEDALLFTHRDVNRTHVAVVLAQSLENLVDADSPQNVVKFRLGCDFDQGDDMISAYLSVTVYVEDVNDHSPQFLDTPYQVTVDELTPTGLTIFRSIHAFDRDKPNTPNSDVQYNIAAGNDAGTFTLESSHKAALVLKKPLDYDNGDKKFQLTITASDRGSPPRSSNASVLVIVQDNDDLPPKFTFDVYRTQMSEFYPLTGRRLHKELSFKDPIQAYDQDTGINVPVRYDLISGNERQLFSLDPVNGSLFLSKEIDLDVETTLSANTFVLQVQAAQIDNPLKTGLARVELEIIDLNDNLPEFEVDFYNISIVENLPNGFSVLQVMASDRDQGDNGEFTYQLEDENGAFSIDPRTGWLTVRDQSILDREQHNSLKMKVYAKEKNPSIVASNFNNPRNSRWRRIPTTQRPQPFKDKTHYVFPYKDGTSHENIDFFEDTNQLLSFVTVEVTLLDANDNNPVFLPSNLYEFIIKADTKIGSYIGKVKAIDPDLGRNGMVLYDLQRTSNLTITSPFQVDAQTGAITLAESPLIEGRHALFIEASDQPTNPSERRYSLAVVSIDVVKHTKGSRPEKPGFIGAPYEFWVGSNVGIGTSVGQLRLTDAMDKNEVIYDLLHGYQEGVPFAVEERSGTITVVDELSKFKLPMYDFEAMATQENINVTVITNTTIHVVDVNDERGALLKGTHSPIIFHVKENLAGAIIGQIVHTNDSLPQANHSKSLRFFIANQQDVTEDIGIGEDGTIFAQRPLDREKRDVYRMTVIAEYNKGLISGAGIYQVTLFVDDENDNPPVFQFTSYEGFIFENSKTNTEVNLTNFIIAQDPDIGNNALFTYTLFGDGHEMFEIQQKTGTVNFVGIKLDREEKSTYLLKIVARDKGNLSSEAKLTINVLDVNDNSPKITQIFIPPGEKVDLVEVNEKTKLKIFRERRNEVTGMITNINLKPKNKFSIAAESLGPLFSMPENIAIGTTVLKIEAHDKDIGRNGQIKYEFQSEIFMPVSALYPDMNVKRYFVINERQGNIVVARTLPPESEFRLNITVFDEGRLSDNLTVRFIIIDVNDHFPMFKKSWYSFNVDESSYSHRVLGKIDATDADYGQNANITYYISPKKTELPFEISPLSGVFSINGELDREKQDHYIIQVIAKDNGVDKKLTSSVTVEIQVLDINDNVPKFYGYDELLELRHPEADELVNHNFESVMILPVYRASLEENSPIGTTVTRIYANDSDFTGNGNGLLFYNIPQRKNHIQNFVIDSKEGIITTTGKLDYESQSMHNVTIIASDLGSPSLSSTALLMLTVIDVPEEIEMSDKPVFISRYYELEIEENSHTPVELVTVNLTEYFENYKMKYTILNDEQSDIKKMFIVDPRNGTLYLVRSPDRENKDTYEIIIRAERQKVSRDLPHMIYPVSDDMLEGMTKYDVKVIVRIKDVNDNAPRFTVHGRPMVTAIPTTATFGYQVIKLQATDVDSGLNSDIRYQIINDQSQRFAIDPISGQVRAVASFARDAGRVFGFDVKATDKKGADDGRSAIANVFVYVLDENKQLVLVVGSRPTDVERQAANITSALAAVTGFDVRVRRIEPNTNTLSEGVATDMYIYAVDPTSNAIVDMEVLQRSLLRKERELKHELAAYKVLEVGGTIIAQARHGKLLSTMEISVVALGCLVFIGAFSTAICILCVRRSRRRRNKPYSRQHLNAFSTDHLSKFGALFPSGGNQCQELNQSYSEADSYIDVLTHHGTKKICPHGNTIEEFGKAHQKCVKGQLGIDLAASDMYNQKHEKSCIKYNQRPPTKKRKGTTETSITSLHSSGQDSGIAEGARCGCGLSNTHTSEESSAASYDDSLKSNHNHVDSRSKPYHLHLLHQDNNQPFTRRASIGHQPLDARNFHRRQSFSDNRKQNTPLPAPPTFERIGSGHRMQRQMSTPDVNTTQSHLNAYFNKNYRRKESAREPMVDYDQSDGEDVLDRVQRRDRRVGGHNYDRNSSKLLELNGQTAVFVATPAAAAIMRRQGSERLVLARPL